MKKKLLILLLSFSLLLTGCSGLLEREYRSVSTHISHTSEEDDSAALRAESYSDLVNGVQYFVSTGQEAGIIHLYHHTGDIEQELAQACQEVLTQDPLGNWALTDIQFQTSRIISYDECLFSFSYRRSPQEMERLQSIVGTYALRQAINRCMSDYDSPLLLETNSYYADKELLLSLVQEAYYAAPGFAMGYPKVSISVYPEDAPSVLKIVEISFTYPQSRQTLQQQAQQVTAQAAALTGVAPGEGEVGCWLLCSRLKEVLNYAEDGQASVYAALSGESADSQAAALAYHLLCSRVGIECMTIHGTRDGSAHWWNLVLVDDVWYHVDVTAESSEDSLLHTGEEMLSGYTWDESAYPDTRSEQPVKAQTPSVSG